MSKEIPSLEEALALTELGLLPPELACSSSFVDFFRTYCLDMFCQSCPHNNAKCIIPVVPHQDIHIIATKLSSDLNRKIPENHPWYKFRLKVIEDYKYGSG